MRSKQSNPSTPLLWRLLDRYERRSAERGVPPGRDVLLKVNAETFPDAWALDGAEDREALFDTVRRLETQGAIRVIYGKGPLRAVPTEIRLGETEAAAAYRLAELEGFRPLRTIGSDLSAHASSLRGPHLPAWMNDYLAGAGEDLATGRVSSLPISFRRLKDDPEALADALALAAELATGRGGMERILSERATGQSKRLASLRGIARDILVLADPRWRVEPPGDAILVLQAYGIRRKPLFLYCAGGIRFLTRSGERSLLDDEPSAAVPEGLLDSLSKALASAGPLTITTIENETPYHLYVEEAGGPQGLGKRAEFVVYTAGWPSSAITKLLRGAAHNTAACFRHWGDPDPAGFQIWWTLRQAIAREVMPFRLNPEWIELASQRESRLLTGEDNLQLQSLRDLLLAKAPAPPDLDAVVSAIKAVLSGGKWIEQERFYA
jgi:hypothetical protein